jgi:GT2 family glycosyltransferase
MVNHMRRNPDLGLLGPVTNNIGNEARIDIFYDDMTQMMARSSQYTRSHVGQLYPLRTAAFFCVMLKRSVFEKIGSLDEAFGRGFFEDDDYCRRIEQAGLKLPVLKKYFIILSASFNKLKSQDGNYLRITGRYMRRSGAMDPTSIPPTGDMK